jgi:ATP-binding cassette, subfamily G (WHITE), member 2, SNQ2
VDNYSVPHPSGDGQLELLKDINGFAKPGTMTALMGSSGAGKLYWHHMFTLLAC